jgi:alpha-tubulin suppressor-like RCC1 family protein
MYTWGCGTLGQLGLDGVMSTNRPKPVTGAWILECALSRSFGRTPASPARLGVFVVVCGIGVSVCVGGGEVFAVFLCQHPCLWSSAGAALCDRGVSIKQVACGTSHCAAISDENVLYTWGSNKYGCLGAEIDEEFSPVPRRVGAFR